MVRVGEEEVAPTCFSSRLHSDILFCHLTVQKQGHPDGKVHTQTSTTCAVRSALRVR